MLGMVFLGTEGSPKTRLGSAIYLEVIILTEGIN